MADPFALRPAGRSLYTVDVPPGPRTPQVSRRRRATVPPRRVGFADLSRRPYEVLRPQPPEEEQEYQDEPADRGTTTSNVTPPTSARPPEPPKPTVTATAPSTTTEGDDEVAEAERVVSRVLPRRDYRTEAAKYLRQPEAEPGEMRPWELAAAVAIPAILGAITGQGTAGFAGSAAALRGLTTGQLARREQTRTGLAAYQKDLADLSKSMEDTDIRRAALALPYLTEKAGERRRNALAEARLKHQQQTATFTQQMQSARLAFDEFRWANPSATDQMNARLREVDQGIRRAQYQAANALVQSRLDEANRHNVEVERLTGEMRAIQREQVSIAQQRVQAALARGGAMSTGEANRVRGYYQFILGEQRRIRGALGNVMFSDPEQAKALEDDLGFYEAEADRLRPQVERIFGFDSESAPSRTPGLSGTRTGTTTGGANADARTWAEGALTEMRRRGGKTRADFIRMRDEMKRHPNAKSVPTGYWQWLDTAIAGATD